MLFITSMSDLFFFDRDWLPIKFGLQNLGATCWFNALVQALGACPAVTNWLENGPSAADMHAEQLRRELAAVFRDYMPETAEGRVPARVQAPANLIDAFRLALRAAGKKFAAGGNETAAEGLRLLLELVDLKMPSNDSLTARIQHDISEWVVCGECDRSNAIIETSEVHFEMFGAMPRTRADFEAALLSGVSEVDADYRCEHCENGRHSDRSRNVGGLRYTRLRFVREMLIVLFNQYSRKAPAPYFPPTFEIPLKDKPPLRYRAVASLEHSGGLDGGHYWTRALRNSEAGESCCALNDSSASAETSGARAEVTPSRNTYLAFYHVEQ